MREAHYHISTTRRSTSLQYIIHIICTLYVHILLIAVDYTVYIYFMYIYRYLCYITCITVYYIHYIYILCTYNIICNRSYTLYIFCLYYVCIVNYSRLYTFCVHIMFTILIVIYYMHYMYTVI